MSDRTFAVTLLYVLVAVGFIITGIKIRSLERRVGCLEHPAGQTSSAAARSVNGKVVVTLPPTVTRICR